MSRVGFSAAMVSISGARCVPIRCAAGNSVTLLVTPTTRSAVFRRLSTSAAAGARMITRSLALTLQLRHKMIAATFKAKAVNFL